MSSHPDLQAVRILPQAAMVATGGKIMAFEGLRERRNETGCGQGVGKQNDKAEGGNSGFP